MTSRDGTVEGVPSERLAWIDASAGIAGDMLLGALVDAGASLDAVRAAVDAVVADAVSIEASTTRRAGMRATKVDVVSLVESPPHRHWREIRALIAEADLSERVARRATSAFSRLAEAEGRAHGTDPESVHFHEVGAWDSIADMVGVCAALEDLGIDRISGGAIAVGSGTIRGSHGEIPVPVPAVAELATSWSIVAGGEGELATPTGVALLVALSDACEPLPAMRLTAVGVGAGTRDTPGRANVVRVLLGDPAGSRGNDSRMAVLETNVDDLDPRLWQGVLADLLEHAAADAWLTPITMKKGRPAHTLSVLAHLEDVDALRERVLALVPTLGVRTSLVERHSLPRTWRTVRVDGSPVRIKIGVRDGRISTATPEFEDVAEVARGLGRPVRDILDAAVASAAEAGLNVGAEPPA